MAQHLQTERIGNAVVVRFTPAWQFCWFDQMAVQEVRGLLANLLETTDAKAVVLNLATVENLGADGLGMLVRFHGQARAKGIAFTLSNLTPTLREHVSLDGLDRLFTIVDDEAEALAAFAKVDQEDAPA